MDRLREPQHLSEYSLKIENSCSHYHTSWKEDSSKCHVHSLVVEPPKNIMKHWFCDLE